MDPRQPPPSRDYNPGMNGPVLSHPRILGGTPCFVGTRVPVRALFDHLEAGSTIDYFLEQFPTVRREQVVELLEYASRQAEADAVAAAGR